MRLIGRVARLRNPYLRCALATPVWMLSVVRLWIVCLRHGKPWPDWGLAWELYLSVLDGWRDRT